MVYLLCGKLCCGKTHYAKQLAKSANAVVLSCDELMLALLPPLLGQGHDEALGRVKQYLFTKAADIAHTGASVILDFGFWSKKDREEASAFFKSRAIPLEWHYIDISEEHWKRNIAERNKRVLAGESPDYYVDDGLLAKCIAAFEVPRREEMDCWNINRRELI